MALWFERPEISRQTAAFLGQFNGAGGVVDGGLDFPAVADDSCILQKTINIRIVVFRDFVYIKSGEGFSEILALP